MHKISEDLWQKNANKKERKDDIECPQSQLQKEMREITKEKEKEVRRESGSPENEVSKGERKGLLNNRDIQCLQRATKYVQISLITVHLTNHIPKHGFTAIVYKDSANVSS